ncbi:MAG: hypothetical protein U9P79_07280 [Candidatus Cloacimonadota bacterium]|nr:hypothetical protein [Candidatus Cloacimonadota bacterium]
MIKKLIRFIAFMLSTMGFLYAGTTPQLMHTPPEFAKYNEPLKLKIEIISGVDMINYTSIFYKKGNSDYIQDNMDIDENSMNPGYVYKIPASFIDQSIEYYFRINLIDGSAVTLPPDNAELSPYYIPLKISSQDEKHVLQKLSPDNEFNAQVQDFFVAISFFNYEDTFVGKTIHLIFDKVDVTEISDITNNLIVYKPAKIKKGIHTIEVKVLNPDSTVYLTDNWKVTATKVSFQDKLPLTFHGNLTLNSRTASTTADSNSYYHNHPDDSNYNGKLKIYGGRKWFSYNGRIYLSSEESDTRQPINKYLFEFNVPHLQLSFGDKNQKFTNKTISGKNIKGYSGILDFKYFKLHSFYGEIKRNIKGNLVVDTLSVPQDTVAIVDTTITNGSYKRNSYGVHLLFGNERKFYVGLSALKAKDDIASEEFAAYPKDNVVFGVDSKLSLFRRRFIIGGEISASLLNNDISDGIISESDLDDLDINFSHSLIEKLQDVIIINENLIPLKPSVTTLKNFTAMEVYTRMFFWNNLLNIKYSRVGGSYNTLANPYLSRDKAGLNVMNTLRLFNNQISLTGGVFQYKNNLSGNKTGTTENSGFITNLSLLPLNKYYPGLSFNYQKSLQDKPVADSLMPIDQTNKMLGFSTSYNIPTTIFHTNHRLRFSFSQTNYINDKNYVGNDSTGYNYNTLKNDMNNYRFTLNTKFKNIPLESNASIYYMKSDDNEVDSLSADGNYIGFLVREEFELNFAQIKNLKPYIELNSIKSGGNISYIKNDFSLGARCELVLFPTPTYIRADVSFMNYKNKTEDNEDYSRTKLRLSLTQKF